MKHFHYLIRLVCDLGSIRCCCIVAAAATAPNLFEFLLKERQRQEQSATEHAQNDKMNARHTDNGGADAENQEAGNDESHKGQQHDATTGLHDLRDEGRSHVDFCSKKKERK